MGCWGQTQQGAVSSHVQVRYCMQLEGESRPKCDLESKRVDIDTLALNMYPICTHVLTYTLVHTTYYAWCVHRSILLVQSHAIHYLPKSMAAANDQVKLWYAGREHIGTYMQLCASMHRCRVPTRAVQVWTGCRACSMLLKSGESVERRARLPVVQLDLLGHHMFLAGNFRVFQSLCCRMIL